MYQKSSSALTFSDRQSLDKWDTGGATWDLRGDGSEDGDSGKLVVVQGLRPQIGPR